MQQETELDIKTLYKQITKSLVKNINVMTLTNTERKFSTVGTTIKKKL